MLVYMHACVLMGILLRCMCENVYCTQIRIVCFALCVLNVFIVCIFLLSIVCVLLMWSACGLHVSCLRAGVTGVIPEPSPVGFVHRIGKTLFALVLPTKIKHDTHD